MSNIATIDGDDYPDAAGKHLDDARSLVDAMRYDGGAYLAGYVVECCLKTLIMLEELSRAVGLGPTALASAMNAGNHHIATGVARGARKARRFSHKLDELSAEAARLAARPSAATAAYKLPAGPSAMYGKISPAWNESLRYRKPGHIDQATAEDWLAEAGDVYARTVGRMRRDGVIY